MKILIAFVAACLIVILAPKMGEATYTGDNGRVAFVRYKDNRPDLYSVNGSGAGLQQITDSKEYESGISWSPDGTRILYSLGGDTYDSNIVVSRADGTHRARVVEMRGGNGGSWSPSGKRIVFANLRKKNPGDLYIVGIDGEGLDRLTDTPRQAENGPVWSPDRDRIAFISTRGSGSLDIWTLSVDGGDFKRVTREVTVCDHGCTDKFGSIDPLDYAPDGDRIIFSANKGDSASLIYIVRENGEGLKEIGEGRRPCFSPNGNKIVFEGPSGSIFKMRIDGTHRVRLTHNRDDLMPRWGAKPAK
jgi:TolB protein